MESVQPWINICDAACKIASFLVVISSILPIVSKTSSRFALFDILTFLGLWSQQISHPE
jgi:hypothetical protein